MGRESRGSCEVHHSLVVSINVQGVLLAAKAYERSSDAMPKYLKGLESINNQSHNTFPPEILGTSRVNDRSNKFGATWMLGNLN